VHAAEKDFAPGRLYVIDVDFDQPADQLADQLAG
jgi:hypothetical protein